MSDDKRRKPTLIHFGSPVGSTYDNNEEVDEGEANA